MSKDKDKKVLDLRVNPNKPSIHERIEKLERNLLALTEALVADKKERLLVKAIIKDWHAKKERGE